MTTRTVPTLSKVDVLEEAKSIVMHAPKFFWLGDATLGINVGKGDFDWHLDDAEVLYHYCVRGTTHYQFKQGDQALPSIAVKAGELLTIPAGVAHKGNCSDDNVILVFARVQPWQV